MTRAARLAGLNRESLYRQLSHRGNPSPASLNAVLSLPRFGVVQGDVVLQEPFAGVAAQFAQRRLWQAGPEGG